ncbi:hypothetical protein NA56DRAFT_695896 [Hyaloscypha hepaticicola]|uniref:Uncharacterized protein n=1 Tax=Hyaloscypha hepaticicola TaxID=2082293 RepID=A0A2J6QPF7_9HELO|nr:hypothetical protein NA56DRAFT_695896 [Hyaloscypha hepaticicola]
MRAEMSLHLFLSDDGQFPVWMTGFLKVYGYYSPTIKKWNIDDVRQMRGLVVGD